MMGPSDSPYAGGIFFLKADFPDNYLYSRQEVKFLTKIYHLNVSPDSGFICMPILNFWSPKTSFSYVLS
jgi:ubiquitin-conjugating enzyme E2 D/E